MKKILAMIMTTALVMALFSGMAFAGNGNGNGKDKKEFKDMGNHWGKQSVEKMQSLGILDGYDDGTFRPDRQLTMAELAVIIDRILDQREANDDEDVIENDDDDAELSDVPSWAKDAVSKGFHKNYFNMKRFHSHVQVDRLTASVAIAKALELEPVTDFTRNPFKDMGLIKISDEDFGYLLALYEEGYIKGYPDGTFNPYSLLNRAQMAAIIEKLIDQDDEDSDDETAPDWDSDSTITASAIGATSVKLTWSAADDDVAVVGYKVIYEVNDVDKVKYVTTRTATITGLEAEEDYTFTVEAKDAAGNWSTDGPSVNVTTIEAVEDAEIPSWDSDSTVTATAIKTNSVDLKWSEADDDIAVVGYKVIYEVNNVDKVKYMTSRTTTITGLESDEDYTFTVEAKDAEGNWSDDGPSVTVTTLAETVVDTTAPTWPSGAALTVSASESGIVTIIWPDAVDNVAVTAYKIYKDGVLIETMNQDSNSLNVTGLNGDTNYIFKVRAVDAAGNLSFSLSKTYLTD
ncbi:MAG TPA: fibronectin type III domain-containing protein [Anaerovoracaceae bacterium]|nr:fibronectin type III domain-containing protein [Anaerovoracaceae bacterium]